MIDWRRLALNPDFQSLFSNEEGNPLRNRIRVLESEAVSLSVTDPLKMMAIKGELHGIRFVERVVREMAEKAAKPNFDPLPLTPTPSPRPSLMKKMLGKIGT